MSSDWAHAPDVVVVGAGVAGLYAGWRLQRAGHQVLVVESARHVGGRAAGMDVPGSPGRPLDLGAMRFTSDHVLVRAMADHLAVPYRQLAATGHADTLFYLRGRRFRAGEIAGDPDRVPYDVGPDARGRTPDELFEDVIGRVLDKAGAVVPRTRRDWNRVKEELELGGRPMFEYGFWNTVSDHLDLESYAYLRDGNGYDCNNWSAGEVMQTQLAGFGRAVRYFRFRDGTRSLVHALRRAVEAHGGQVRTGTEVRGVRLPGAGHRIELSLRETGGDTREVTAPALVLAVPPRALDLMDLDVPAVDQPSWRQDVESVVSHRVLRVVLGFAEPWWEDVVGRGATRSLTDLPIRQVYYLDDHRVTGGDAVLSVACNDDRAYDFFTPAPAFAHWRRGGALDGPDPHQLTRIGQDVIAQLRLLHGTAVPSPTWMVVRDWGHDPFGGGYHGWRPGRRGSHVAARMRRPWPRHDVFVCGSAYSDIPTWMEGALSNTERLVQDHFGLASPDWLPPATYLGW